MLRAHCPIRTVEEEQQKQFKDAKPCIVPDTIFARVVGRALRACFALLKFAYHIQVVYIGGSTGKVDVYFEKKTGYAEDTLPMVGFCLYAPPVALPTLVSNQLCQHNHAVILLPCGGRALGPITCIHVQGASDVSTSGTEIHAADWTTTAVPAAHDPVEAVPRWYSGQLGRQ
jgi:hypothetical protein